MTVENIKKAAARWGYLLRKETLTYPETEEMGRLSTGLFMQMIKHDSAAPGWLFDQIVKAAATPSNEGTYEIDVINLFGM